MDIGMTMDLTDEVQVKALKANLLVVFESPQGKEVMKFLEKIGGWTPTVFDSNETNAVIARDANRRLIGTIKTLLEFSPEQIVALAQKQKGRWNGQLDHPDNG